MLAHLVDEKDLTPEALEEILKSTKAKEPGRAGSKDNGRPDRMRTRGLMP